MQSTVFQRGKQVLSHIHILVMILFLFPSVCQVQFLMSSLEALQQRAAKSASASPPATIIRDELSIKLSKELKELR